MAIRVLIGLLCCTLVGGGLWLAARADDSPGRQAAQPKEQKDPEVEKEKSVRTLMRKKLAAAQDILEGLTTEDYEMIGRGAKLLKSLARSADFQVSRDMMYVQHSNEFQNLADKLETAADKHKLDKASLHYVELTMNCIECHRFVRDVLIAGESP